MNNNRRGAMRILAGSTCVFALSLCAWAFVPAPSAARVAALPPVQVAPETATVSPSASLPASGPAAAPDKLAAYRAMMDGIKAANKPFYGAHHFTLSNGLQVVVVPNHRAPVATHIIWYKTGGADEPFGISGTAHFLEHLLFKGSTNVAPGAFSQKVKTMGGQDNAFTSWDYTAFYQTIPVEHLEEVMKMEADRVRGANPPKDHFLSERNVVLEERRQTLDNDPGSRLSEQVRQALYVNHPYGRPIIGWMEEISKLDWSAIKAFYDRWYSPSNAILIVAGDVEPEAFRDMAEKIYGVVPSHAVPARTRPPVAAFDTAKTLVMRDPLVRQRSFYRSALLDVTAAEDPIGSVVSGLVTMMMDGGATSRFYKSIVMEQELAVGVSVSANVGGMDYGTLSYGGTPVDGVPFARLEDAIKAELTKAATEGFTQDELDRAKNRLIDAQAFELDSATGAAMVFGYGLMSGLDADFLEYWTHIVDRVTLADVNAKAAELFALDGPIWRQSVYGYLLPPDVDGPFTASVPAVVQPAAPASSTPEPSVPAPDASAAPTKEDTAP